MERGKGKWVKGKESAQWVPLAAGLRPGAWRFPFGFGFSKVSAFLHECPKERVIQLVLASS